MNKNSSMVTQIEFALSLSLQLLLSLAEPEIRRTHEMFNSADDGRGNAITPP